MGADAKMQQNTLERLRAALADGPRSRELLAQYVTELKVNRQEDEIFRRLAFCGVALGDSPRDINATSLPAEWYETLSLEDKSELRQWWHQKIRSEAYRYDDLRKRLSWQYFV
jgi:hypothetical protein